MSTARRTRYAIIGLGGRSAFFYNAIATTFSSTAEIVALLDTNQTRMDYGNDCLQQLNYPRLPTYKPIAFAQMISETRPEQLIITTMDRTHDHYIILAMAHNLDVITEKPMTIDAPRIQSIVSAIKQYGRALRVTFNYRYAPHNTKIFELIQSSGAIGTVNAIHFEWMLNTSHGADYFRRWHRDKRNSGGLLVHKSTHHFDLVNYWLQSRPQTVFAMGDLKFYGRENAERRGVEKFYTRAHGQENARADPFALHMQDNPTLKAMYLDAEAEDSYYRDQSVFSDGISIEDTMSVMVRYKSGALLTYSLTAYSPMEGFRVSFTGTKGRIDLEVIERPYINSGGEQGMEGALETSSIIFRPMFGKPEVVDIPVGQGGHGGGDPELLNDLFGNPGDDIYKRRAGHVEGALSILTGIAANRSLNTGQAVDVDTLVKIT